MKKKFFIYGGLYKTATEFISKNYLEKLDKTKYEIFTFYKGGNNIFYHTFLKIIYSGMSVEEGKKIIFKFLDDYNKPNIIIQSSGFYGHRHNGHSDFQKRFDVLEEIFEQPKYIIVLRNQKTSIYSQWNAGIKKRVKIPFDEYTNANENFLKNQNILQCNEITNYKMFDYNLILKPYIDLYVAKDSDRAIFLVYEELKSDPKLFFKKLSYFINAYKNKFNINFEYRNKSNFLEEINLIGFIFFRKTHVLILNFIYFFYKIFKTIGFNVDMKPPYQNYKFERSLNSFSMIYLNFLNKFFFKIFFKKKLKNYYNNKKKRITEIEVFYKEKNFKLDKKLNLQLDKFKYY